MSVAFAPRAKSGEIDFASLSVLVVDDASHMRAILRTILAGLGVRQVKEAGDGADALERMNGTTFDIVFLDWEMPVLSGPETVALMRRHKDPIIASTSVVIVTAHADKARVEQARALGVQGMLVKPVSARLIHDRMVAVLRNRKPIV